MDNTFFIFKSNNFKFDFCISLEKLKLFFSLFNKYFNILFFRFKIDKRKKLNNIYITIKFNSKF